MLGSTLALTAISESKFQSIPNKAAHFLKKNSECSALPRQRKCSAMRPRSRARLQQEQKCGWSLDPMGLRVYLAEAAGRERSKAHISRFSVPCESRGGRVLCT